MKIYVKAICRHSEIGHGFQWAAMDEKPIHDLIRANDGEEVNITIDTDVLKRSAAQNRFFHSVIIGTFMRTFRLLGMPRWNDREFIKEVILKKPYLTVGKGTDGEYVRGTSGLTTKEMANFITFCLQLLVEIGGELDDEGRREYEKMVRDYALEKSIEDAATRTV